MLIFDKDPFSRPVYVMCVEKNWAIERKKMLFSGLLKITGHLYSLLIFLEGHTKRSCHCEDCLVLFSSIPSLFFPAGGRTAMNACFFFCTNIENNEPSIAALWIELYSYACVGVWVGDEWVKEQKKLTDHIQIGNLTFHRIGVYLTHIPSLVRFFDISYFEYPGAFFCVRYYHSMIFRYDVRLYGENGLGIDTQPRNLNGNKLYGGQESKK